jgi:hypothetical protein
MGYVQLKKLYVNGCSWTDGDTLDLAGLTKMGEGRNYSYPKLVANELQFELIDESRYGGSINRIIRMCWEYLMKNDVHNTTFILEIPNGFRDEVYSNEIGRYFNITSGNLDNANDNTEDNVEWHLIKKDVINSYFNFCNFEEFAKKEYINLMSLIYYIKQYTNNIYLLQPYDIINKQKGLYEHVCLMIEDILYHDNKKNLILYLTKLNDCDINETRSQYPLNL